MVTGMVTGQGRVEQAVRVWLPVGFFLLLALFPFYWMAVTSVKPNAELYEAATIDGAGGWQRFGYVTLPLLQPIILIVTLFSVIFTFADFQLVYVLTHGGPQNATQLFATYAFDIAMGAGQLGLGASVALTMLPALALLIIALTIYLRRR